MFDDVSGMMRRCTDDFRDGVRDPFSASVIADVLDPILVEINSLRHFSEDFQRHLLEIDQVLEDARAIRPFGEGQA